MTAQLTVIQDVLFQISRVGNDSGAVKFINDLKSDPELKNILHCTSCKRDIAETEELVLTSGKTSTWALSRMQMTPSTHTRQYVFP